ncbi:MAG TPA: methyltransferase domain-containing protein [Myxococcales bacterium]
MVDGIPVVLRDVSQANSYGLAFGEPPEKAAARAADPDAVALRQSLDHFSTYLDASWGDFATPPAEFGFGALAGKLRAAAPRVKLALELGCGVGRGAYELSRSAELVVGLDRSGASLRRARALVRGEELLYARRAAGRSYRPAAAHAPPAKNVELVCGDALDPPFPPGTFGRVAALNLLDNVPSPRALLHHLHQLAASGGEVLIASPYAWRDEIVEPAERLGGADPAAALRDEVRALAWMIEEEAELPWALRQDARTSTTYTVHFIRARRGN